MDKIKDLERDLVNREKIKSLFETHDELPEDEPVVKEFIYANDDEDGDDPDGNWWLMLTGICLIWTILGIIGAIKVIQWTILFLKNLLG